MNSATNLENECIANDLSQWNISIVQGTIPRYRWEDLNILRMIPTDGSGNIVFYRLTKHRLSVLEDYRQYECLSQSYGRECHICSSIDLIQSVESDFSLRSIDDFYIIGLDCRDHTDGVQLIRIPQSLKSWIEAIKSAPDFAEINNILSGVDLTAIRTRTGSSRKNVRYFYSFLGEPTPLSDQSDLEQQWLEEAESIHNNITSIADDQLDRRIERNLKAANRLLRYYGLDEIR